MATRARPAPDLSIPRVSRGSGLSGVAGMLGATFLWGCSFTWVKAAGAGVNEALGRPEGSPVGPLAHLGWRFALAAVLWAALHPRSLRGWSRRSVRDGLLLGTALVVPMSLQVIGLDRTSEAVSAFLTSLTIVFVPLTLALILRRPPRKEMWVAVALAMTGIYLMTGAAPTGFGLGELLGLACGVSFTAHILLIDTIMKRERLGRMTLAQFALTGAVALGACALLPAGREALTLAGVRTALGHGLGDVSVSPASIFAGGSVAVNFALATIFSTLGAFTLQFFFQPRITPTLAAVILLAEPVFAAFFAWVAMNRSLSAAALGGAALILAANVYAVLRDAGGEKAA